MKYLKKIAFFIIVFCTVHINSFAVSIDGTYQIEENISESFKKWQNLSEEEKENTIMPNIYDITSIKKNETKIQNRLLRLLAVNSSNKTSYRLDNFIDIIVKDQKNTTGCWAFALTSALETNISLTSGVNSEEYSTRHMEYYCTSDYMGFKRNIGDGVNSFNVGLAYYTSGNGPVLETDMPFENNMDPLSEIEETKLINAEVQKQISDYVEFTSIYKNTNGDEIVYTSGGTEISEDEVESIRDEIKSHIENYGGISTMTLADANYPQYNNNSNIYKTTAVYCDNNNILPNHAVTIIGWDDNYSKDNFNSNCRPKNDGAYIALNSYGTDNFDNGYIYISYDDVFVEQNLVGIVSATDIDYDTIYQYDELGATASFISDNGVGYGANVFDRDDIDGEYLTEVGVSLQNYAKVQVYINAEGSIIDISDMIEATEESDILAPGYHVLELKNKIKISGDKFTVVVKYISQDDSEKATVPLEYPIENTCWENASGNKDESYISSNGEVWKMPVKGGKTYLNVCIKAFSVIDEIYNYKIENDYIVGIEPNTTGEIFVYNFGNIQGNNETYTDFYIVDDNEELSPDSIQIIKTGQKLKVSLENGENREYVLVVNGDIDGNGIVNLVDLTRLKKFEIGKMEFNELQLKAADMTLDGRVNLVDVTRMRKYIIKKSS